MTANYAPFDKMTFAGEADPHQALRIEAIDVGYSNLFIPINNGFIRPLKKLIGGKYPRARAEEGGVTYGFGFHCHDNSFGCFTPVVKDEVDGAFLELEFYAPSLIPQMIVRCRPGGNDDDALATDAEREWESHRLIDLRGSALHKVKLSLRRFDPDIAIAFDLEADAVIFIRLAKIVPFYEAKSNASGAWSRTCSAPFPYGFSRKEFEYVIHRGDQLERTEKITVSRNDISLSRSPTEAACRWGLNRYADPRLKARRGGFPLAYYDSYAKTFYVNGHTMWIRPYMVMSLVEIAARRTVLPTLLQAVTEYVCTCTYLDSFFPEKRRGYLEYCGSGNFFYGAVAMLWQINGDTRLKELLLRFVDKYLVSQKIYTAMRSYPDQCHNYRGDLLPTITACGHEETMHAAIIEAYRVTHSPEILHEALNERGMGFLENPIHGAVRVPERLKDAENAVDFYGYYVSMHTLWARSRDAIHYRAEGLIRLFQVTGNEHWMQLASRRSSNYLRYIGEKVGNEFLDINFEYPQSRTSQFQSDPSLNTSTGGTDGEYFQDIYTAAGILQHYPIDAYLREKVRRAIMLVAAVIRTNTDDPESHGEAWIPHYAWKGDYENKSAGSRIMSPWIAAGTLLRAESAGFYFDDRAVYTGPLEGCRKLVDADSVPEEIRLGFIEGYMDMPDGEIALSKLEFCNPGKEELIIELIRFNDQDVVRQVTVPPGSSHFVDVLPQGAPGKQNRFRIELHNDSPARMIVKHHFLSNRATLFAAGMNEYFGGNFVRRNIVLHNPYAPIAEKSFHDPLKPDSYYRLLPSDEGYGTVQEVSYVRTWQPFLQLGADLKVTRTVLDGASSELHFRSETKDREIVIYDDLWTDENGVPINGDVLDGEEALFRNPSIQPVIRVRKTGEKDILHPECTLPSAVYTAADGLHADIVNYIGASDFLVEIIPEEPLWLGIPTSSEETSLSFNGEIVFRHHQLKLPNGFLIEAVKEEDGYIRLLLLHAGKIRVRVSSDARVPGSPAGVCAAWIDATGLSSQAVRLRWQSNLEAVPGHYNIYRAKESTGPWMFLGWSPETVFTDFSSNKDERYFYAVSAISHEGEEGAKSKAAEITPLNFPHPS